jgi:hypothetical protein
VYGALSTEPTPLPVMDVLGKNLTICGYQLFEITTDSARLEPANRFINDGLAERQAEARYRQDVSLRRDCRGTSLHGVEPGTVSCDARPSIAMKIFATAILITGLASPPASAAQGDYPLRFFGIAPEL